MRTITLALVLAACQPTATQPVVESPAAPAQYELAGKALGTTWHVKWVESSPKADQRERVQVVIERILGEVDAGMSTWRDDSELALVRAQNGPVEVSEDTATVVRAALELSSASGGAFDPTVQPLMELWGFHGKRREHAPTDEEVASAAAQVDWRRVVVGRSPAGRPTVDASGTALDLSAIAKGHAVDRVAHGLSELQLGSHFVEVGGEVRMSGPGANGPAWSVGVELPVVGGEQGSELALVVRATNASVATSGNYRNLYQLDGETVVHTMDPRAGRPTVSRVASATVLAPDCRTADGLATALMVMTPEDGLNLVKSMPHVDAALMLFDGEDFVLQRTPGMAQRSEVVHKRVRLSTP